MIKEEEKRFDINPHVIRQLGKELVPDNITALMELVKNAYDADSDYVKITINTEDTYTEEPIEYKTNKGYIVVEDGGIGMDEETILKSWLIISYSNKRPDATGIKKVTRKKERTPLGDKGLGRLSTQRLANYCEIFTTAEDSNERIHVAFNWNDFDTAEKLSSVPVIFNKQTSTKTGTKLILTDLNSPMAWKGDELAQLKGELAQLISPFIKKRHFNVYLTVNGEVINIMQEFHDLLPLSRAAYIFDFDGSWLTIKGTVKQEKLIGNTTTSREEYHTYILPDNGSDFLDFFFTKEKSNFFNRVNEGSMLSFTQRIALLDIPKLKILNGDICNPGTFSGEIYDFALNNKDEVGGIYDKFSEYKLFIKGITGVKIYRDGFAVFPYGFKDNDWLGLRAGTTSGSSYYGLRPDNTIGYVEISEGRNINLKDKTDRTGFISNEYSDNFIILMKDFVIKECNRAIELIRRSYREYIKQKQTESSSLKTTNDVFKFIEKTSAFSATTKSEVTSFKAKLTDITDKTNKLITDLPEDSIFINEENKEINQLHLNIKKILNEAQYLLNKIEDLLKSSTQLDDTIKIIKPQIEKLEQQIADFSHLAAVGLTAEGLTHEIGNIVHRLSEYNNKFRQQIQIEPINKSDCLIMSEYIKSTANGLNIQLKHIDPALRYTRESKVNINLGNFFETEEKEYYKHLFIKDEINLNIEIISSFVININKGRLVQILDNIINNSIYWINWKKSKDSNYRATLTIRIDKPFIYIYDNADGVSESVEQTLFDPFVTMKPKGNGRGLGLFIVNQLLDAVGCTISLSHKRNSHNKRYIFILNFSNITL